jgi:hypothetical protein
MRAMTLGCLKYESAKTHAGKIFGVMPGLDPGIHEAGQQMNDLYLSAVVARHHGLRVKPGNDRATLLALPAAHDEDVEAQAPLGD